MTISISQLRKAIKELPSDEPIRVKGVWYTTQKQHWLGWIKSYKGPGAYKRKNWHRDARFVYNHVVCPGLLMYLIRSIGLPADNVSEAEIVNQIGTTEMETAGAIRKAVPWEMVYVTIWGNKPLTRWQKFRNYISATIFK